MAILQETFTEISIPNYFEITDSLKLIKVNGITSLIFPFFKGVINSGYTSANLCFRKHVINL